MKEIDFFQWAADTERLLIAGLSNRGETPIDYDEETIEAVRSRCIEMFGEMLGRDYYRGLIAGLPDRRPDLFPELSERY